MLKYNEDEITKAIYWYNKFHNNRKTNLIVVFIPFISILFFNIFYYFLLNLIIYTNCFLINLTIITIILCIMAVFVSSKLFPSISLLKEILTIEQKEKLEILTEKQRSNLPIQIWDNLGIERLK